MTFFHFEFYSKAQVEQRKKPEEEEEDGEAEDMEMSHGAVVEMSPEEEEGEVDEGETSAQLTAHDESGALVSANANGGAGAAVNANAVAQQQGAVEAYGTHQPVMPEYRDITPLLNLPQVQAARQLKMPMSTLSKRWKEAVRVRKWPYRQVAKLDKEIMTLLHNIPPRGEGDAVPTPPEIEQALGVLLRRRQEELRPVRIRM